jgi:hypothetical protein
LNGPMRPLVSMVCRDGIMPVNVGSVERTDRVLR